MPRALHSFLKDVTSEFIEIIGDTFIGTGPVPMKHAHVTLLTISRKLGSHI